MKFYFFVFILCVPLISLSQMRIPDAMFLYPMPSQLYMIQQRQAAFWANNALTDTYRDCGVIPEARAVCAAKRTLTAKHLLRIRASSQITFRDQDYMHVTLENNMDGWIEKPKTASKPYMASADGGVVLLPGAKVMSSIGYTADECERYNKCITLKDHVAGRVSEVSQVDVRGRKMNFVIDENAILPSRKQGLVEDSAMTLKEDLKEQELDTIEVTVLKESKEQEKSKTEAQPAPECDENCQKNKNQQDLQDISLCPASSPGKCSVELKTFMCIYGPSTFSSSQGAENFCSRFNKFDRAIQKAAQEFKLPPAVIACTAFIESNLKYNASSDQKKCRGRSQQDCGADVGLAQATAAAVEDTLGLLREGKYVREMKNYLGGSTERYTQQNIRFSDNPEVAIGFIALRYRSLIDQQIKRPFESNPTSNKNLMLLSIGYNTEPYSLDEYNDVGDFDAIYKKARVIRSANARNYFNKMKHCVDKKQYDVFENPLKKANAKVKNNCESKKCS